MGRRAELCGRQALACNSQTNYLQEQARAKGSRMQFTNKLCGRGISHAESHSSSMKQHCSCKPLMFVLFLLRLLLLLMLLLLFRLPLLFLLIQLRVLANQTETDEFTCVPRTSRGVHRSQHKDTREHATARGLATTRARKSKLASANIQIRDAYHCDTASTGIHTPTHMCTRIQNMHTLCDKPNTQRHMVRESQIWCPCFRSPVFFSRSHEYERFCWPFLFWPCVWKIYCRDMQHEGKQTCCKHLDPSASQTKALPRG